uniref:Uncharacterized protein n=1 Tax=Anopheles maculatus TaxID=74869 RepID=A0A182SPK4_9DIPT
MERRSGMRVAWPSGLRRWFKAPVSSEAWAAVVEFDSRLKECLEVRDETADAAAAAANSTGSSDEGSGEIATTSGRKGRTATVERRGSKKPSAAVGGANKSVRKAGGNNKPAGGRRVTARRGTKQHAPSSEDGESD